jgi:Holliday junction DNA helicase RuvA
MIARLRGTLVEKSPQFVVIDCGGVGYHAWISLTTFCRLPDAGAKVDLVVVTILRENALELFGFQDPRERDMFVMLRTVSGIGPRLAISILSGIDPGDLADVLASSDVERLVAVPGVGRKTAERLIVDLKGKVEVSPQTRNTADLSTDVENDAVSALVGLGYKPVEARKAVTASIVDSKRTIEDVIKRSLARLVS